MNVLKTSDLIIGELTEAIHSIRNGGENWNLIGDIVRRRLPGTATVFARTDTHARIPGATFHTGFDDRFMRRFEAHYARLNPWIQTFDRIRSGEVLCTETNHPVALMKKTEFYNDWLKPHGDIDGASGIKLYGGDGITIFLAIHYPRALSDKYDPLTVAALEGVRPLLMDCTNETLTDSENWIRFASQSTLVARNEEPSIVIDRSRKVHSVNMAAKRLFDARNVMTCRRGELTFVSAKADEWLSLAMLSVQAGQRLQSPTLVIQEPNSTHRAQLYPIPRPSVLMPVVAGDLFLLLLKNLAGNVQVSCSEEFKTVYGLTQAEAEIAEALANGNTIAGIAKKRRTTVNTVRSQLKWAMQKCECHSQIELVRLGNLM